MHILISFSDLYLLGDPFGVLVNTCILGYEETVVLLYDRITPVLKELHWLPVKQRIIFKILLFTYKAQNALVPQYISDFLVQYKPSRALRSSDKKLLQVPHFKLKTYGGRSFSYIAPFLWNQLPSAIRQAPSLATFKSSLKTHLFDQVFN